MAGNARSGFLPDCLALAVLTITALYLFYEPAHYIGLGLDSIEMAAVMESHGLPWISVHWFAGRPFHCVPYKLAAWLGSGAVTGYNFFQFACLLTSAYLVYALVRLMATGLYLWAYAAACLKLVWSANWDIFDNSCLPIYFAETCFWLALLVFAALAQRPLKISPWTLAAGGLMSACLLVAAGTYQTCWGPLLLAPLALLYVAGGAGHVRSNRQVFFIWYAAASAGVLFALYHYLRVTVPQEATFSPTGILPRLLRGLYAALVTSIESPLRFDPGYGIWYRTFVPVVFLFTAVLLILARRRPPGRSPLAPQVRLLMASLPWVLVSILPPLVAYEPVYGSRHLHFAAAGTIGLLMGGLGILSAVPGRAGAVLAVIGAVPLFAGSLQMVASHGKRTTATSIEHQRFFYQLTRSVPTVREGTVVVLERTPSNWAHTDFTMTWIFRALTGTQRTVFVTDNPGLSAVPGGATVWVETAVDLSDPVVRAPPPEYNIKFPAAVTNVPRLLPSVARQEVHQDSLLVLRWDPVFQRLRVTRRHEARAPIGHKWSRLAQVLFRGRESWSDQTAVVVNHQLTPYFADTDPVRSLYPFHWFPTSSAVGALDGGARTLEYGPRFQCRKVSVNGEVSLYLSVPEQPQAAFRVEFDLEAASAAQLSIRPDPEGGDLWTFPPAIAPAWVSPPLPPGFHRLILDARSGQVQIVNPRFTLEPAVAQVDSPARWRNNARVNGAAAPVAMVLLASDDSAPEREAHQDRDLVARLPAPLIPSEFRRDGQMFRLEFNACSGDRAKPGAGRLKPDRVLEESGRILRRPAGSFRPKARAHRDSFVSPIGPGYSAAHEWPEFVIGKTMLQQQREIPDPGLLARQEQVRILGCSELEREIAVRLAAPIQRVETDRQPPREMPLHGGPSGPAAL